MALIAVVLQVLGMVGVVVAVALLAGLGWAVLALSVEMLATGIALELAPVRRLTDGRS
jgi:hypothetical protein